MANVNKRPWYKSAAYLGVIVAIVATVVTIILGLLSPPPPDFSIAVNPMGGPVHQGGVFPYRLITTAITVEGIQGYKHPVSLSASGQPSGIVITFVPPLGEAKPSYTSNVTISVDSNVPVGSYEITIKGVGADGKEHSCKYTLNVMSRQVTPTPTLTPSLTPSPTPTLQINIGCTSNSGCDSGEICKSGKCVEGCTSNSDCGYREICKSGKCVTVECTSSAQCGSCYRCSENTCRYCGKGPYGCYC